MPIKYIKGNLLESDCDVIAHGCNCFNTMGAGIARQIARKWPQAKYADDTTLYGSKAKLGTYTKAYIAPSKPDKKPLHILNLYTQYRYGRGLHFDYNAYSKALAKLKAEFGGKGLKIGIPKIGAGLAGGNWTLIAEITNKIFHDEVIYVYVI